jgi:hypothetical protein
MKHYALLFLTTESDINVQAAGLDCLTLLTHHTLVHNSYLGPYRNVEIGLLSLQDTYHHSYLLRNNLSGRMLPTRQVAGGEVGRRGHVLRDGISGNLDMKWLGDMSVSPQKANAA